MLGTVDSVRVEGSEVVGLIRFSRGSEIAPLVEDVRSGVIQHLTVGYEVQQWRDGIDSAGNRTRTATQWTIREASFVAVPADRNARTRNLPATGREPNRTDKSAHWRPEPESALKSSTSWSTARPGSRKRAEEILFEMQLRTPAQPSRARTTRNDGQPGSARAAMGEALYTRIAPVTRRAVRRDRTSASTIPELARECLHPYGVKIHGGVRRQPDRARACTPRRTFALILADTVDRTLRASLQRPTSAVRRLARETTAADFRTKHRLMLDSSGMTLEKVERAWANFVRERSAKAEETYKLDSFGRIFGISRKAHGQRRLGAFTDIAAASDRPQRIRSAEPARQLISNGGLGPTM